MLIRAALCALALVIAAIIPAQVQAQASHSPARYSQSLRFDGHGTQTSQMFETYSSFGWHFEWKCGDKEMHEMHVNLEVASLDRVVAGVVVASWYHHAQLFRAGPMVNETGHGAKGTQHLPSKEYVYRISFHTVGACHYGIILNY